MCMQTAIKSEAEQEGRQTFTHSRQAEESGSSYEGRAVCMEIRGGCCQNLTCGRWKFSESDQKLTITQTLQKKTVVFGPISIPVLPFHPMSPERKQKGRTRQKKSWKKKQGPVSLKDRPERGAGPLAAGGVGEVDAKQLEVRVLRRRAVRREGPLGWWANRLLFKTPGGWCGPTCPPLAQSEEEKKRERERPARRHHLGRPSPQKRQRFKPGRVGPNTK